MHNLAVVHQNVDALRMEHMKLASKLDAVARVTADTAQSVHAIRQMLEEQRGQGPGARQMLEEQRGTTTPCAWDPSTKPSTKPSEKPSADTGGAHARTDHTVELSTAPLPEDGPE